MKFLSVVALSLFLAMPAFANIVFSPGVSYSQDQLDEAGNTSKRSTTTLDFRLGYVLPMGLYVGGMYNSTSVTVGSSDEKAFSVGPTIGYHSMMGFYTLLTYHIMGEREVGPVTYTGAQGPQVDLGWVFPLTHYFAIGPQMTWKSIEYSKADTVLGEFDSDRKQTSIDPYISLWFMF